MDLDLFVTTIGHYKNKEIIDQYMPVIDEYLDRCDQKMYGIIDNHKTLYGSKFEEEFNSDPRMFGMFDWCLDTTLEHFSRKGFNTDGLHLKPYFFVSEITKGGYFGVHTHPNCNFSGCFYLDSDDSSANIIFHDPRSHYKALVLPRKDDVNPHQHSLTPHTGDLYVWESWLEHEVDISNTDKPRKTLVFNI